MSPPIIELRAITYRYPSAPDDAPALAQISLRLERGTRTALLGPNGAGKSTLLLHLNGTLRPDQGELHHRGERVHHDRRGLERLRRAVALVFQDPDDQLFAGTVAQDVSFGPMNLGLPLPEVSARVDRALHALGLHGLADRPPHQLSQGQRKRVALAGALAMHPEVLVLDEPTAGLDPEGTEALLDQLERLRAAGLTILLSTHDVELAHRWADRVVILHAGHLLADGPAPTVLADAAVMARAGLRRPLAHTLAERLRAAGVDPAIIARALG